MIRWVTVFIDRPRSGFDALAEFWSAVTGTTRSVTRGADGEFATLVPVEGDACLRIQRTLDGSAGSHLDVHVDDVREAARRAVGLGADVVSDLGSLVVMRSRGDLAFCLVGWDGESVRPSPVGDRGRRTLVDQVCIDIAPDRFDDECSFWAELTGWTHRPGSQPEFAVLGRPHGQPLRFLLQRRDRADEGVPTTCHLDVACDDVAASVADHVALGAVLVRRFPRWTVMADPAGVRYCLTSRDPDTGTHGAS